MGDKECPFSGVTKSGSLEEGARKRCSEYVCVCVGSVYVNLLTYSVILK